MKKHVTRGGADHHSHSSSVQGQNALYRCDVTRARGAPGGGAGGGGDLLSLEPPTWVPDSHAGACTACSQQFRSPAPSSALRGCISALQHAIVQASGAAGWWYEGGTAAIVGSVESDGTLHVCCRRPLARGRHHCRLCGNIFCTACCSSRVLLPPNFRAPEPERACDECAALLAPLQPFLAGAPLPPAAPCSLVWRP